MVQTCLGRARRMSPQGPPGAGQGEQPRTGEGGRVRGVRAQAGQGRVHEGGAAWHWALEPVGDSEASTQGKQMDHDRESDCAGRWTPASHGRRGTRYLERRTRGVNSGAGWDMEARRRRRGAQHTARYGQVQSQRVGVEGRRRKRGGCVALMWKNILAREKCIKRLGSNKV